MYEKWLVMFYKIRNRCSNPLEPVGTEFLLQNTSTLPCNISVCLRDAQSKVFQFEPESLCIEPNLEETLKLYAVPEKRAKYENKLLLSIENNPKVEVINLSCTGCHVNFVIRPKLIDINHALVNQTTRQEVILENVSDISVYWKIIEVDRIPKVLKFSSLSGNMLPSTKQRLLIEYTPLDGNGIPRMIIMIHVIKWKII